MLDQFRKTLRYLFTAEEHLEDSPKVREIESRLQEMYVQREINRFVSGGVVTGIPQGRKLNVRK